MKANEFRVTNFVNYNGEMFPIIFIGLDSVMLIRKDQSTFTVKLDRIKPIKISEKALLSCGFQKITTNEYWFVIPLKDRSLNVSTYGNVEINSWDRLSISHGCICEYVHQLQNLYFSLTGGVELVSSTEP